MSIDWITVGAQIVNFLVLVWLLKRFLYRPILDGIDAREAEIAQRMREAARIRAAADGRQAEYEQQIAALERMRADALDAAQREGETQRKAMLEDARKRLRQEADERAAHRAETARAFAADLQRAGGEALLSLTGKALRDLAGETLESRIVERALAQLPDRGRELAMTSERGHTALALTRDPLPAQTQERLRVALSEVLPDARLDFRTDPARPLGLGLQLGGVQVDWTIESYLDDLAGRLDELAAATAKKGVSDAA